MTQVALIDSAIPTALDDATATRLGLKVYVHGTSYNGGNAPTVTLTGGGGTLSSVPFSSFIPYQTSDGSWRMKFNITVLVSSTARTAANFAIAGVTYFNTAPGDGQVVSGGVVSVAAGISYAGNSSDINTSHTSATAGEYWFSGDVKLASKTTWAY
jgi:hypothetical protein